MYIKIRNQEEIIRKAIEKAGSYRKLSKILKIPRSTIVRYVKKEAVPEERFDSITKFLGLENKKKAIEEKLPDNFKQKIGGLSCVIAKKKKGTFNRDMKKLQDIQSNKLKKWHKSMKENKPKEYYNMQYSRFKKIGGYKYQTNKGERVRNLLEKQTADILFSMDLDYQYEPLVNIGDRYFFPDFLVKNKVIIECTAWKGTQKEYKLKEKIELLKKKYTVFVVIPKNLYSYYQTLNSHLILGLEDFVPVAQTFKEI